MKKLLLVLFIFSSSFAAMAQKANQCGIIIPPTSLRSDFASVYEASGYINNMLDRIHWQENFLVKEQNGINNAYATIIRNQRYIVYDNRFLESLDQLCRHQMGFHKRTGARDGSPLLQPYDHRIRQYALKRAGSRLFLRVCHGKNGRYPCRSKSCHGTDRFTTGEFIHPAKADRLNAIASGWNSVSGVSSGSPSSNPVPAPQPQKNPVPSPQPQKNPAPAETDASWIHLSLYGNSNMTVFLSDDGRQFTQAEVKTSQPFVFKYEVYEYGWLRFGNNGNARTYKLYHGRDYAIVWSRRMNNWTVVEVQ